MAIRDNTYFYKNPYFNKDTASFQVGAILGGGIGAIKTIEEAKQEDPTLAELMQEMNSNVEESSFLVNSTATPITGLLKNKRLPLKLSMNTPGSFSYITSVANFIRPVKSFLEEDMAPITIPMTAGALLGGAGGYYISKTHPVKEDSNYPHMTKLNQALQDNSAAYTGITAGAVLGGGAGVGGLIAKAKLASYFPDKINTPSLVRQDFSYMSNTANFMSLTKVGVGLGAMKGLVEKPKGQEIDPATGQIVNKKYSPLRRVANIGVNAALGGALGAGASKLGLNDPRKIGHYVGNAANYAEDKIVKARNMLPEVEIITNG